jgi:predicted kinase
MAAELIMTKGLPASGKSTWADAEVLAAPAGAIVRINKDALRIMLHAGRWKGKKTEKQIIAARDAMVEAFLADGLSVIVDDTNLAPFHETRLRELATRYGVTFSVKDFTDVPLDICLERDWKRAESVGPKVIQKMWTQYLKPPAPEWIDGFPSAIIVDIDGTLALFDGKRGPYDWEKLWNDDCDPTVALLVREARLRGDAVLLVSGRDGAFHDPTAAWLKENEVEYDELWMRFASDNRPDRVVKDEIYRTHIEGRYNISYVIDDRDSVVALWRGKGLKTLQVNYGAF